MKASSAYIYQKLNKMSHDELLAAAMQYYEKYCIARAELDELKNTFRYTADELNRTKAEYGDLAIKADTLSRENIRLQNQANEFRKNRFGRKSEKMNGKSGSDEFDDPLSEEMDEAVSSCEKQENNGENTKARKTKRPSCRQVKKEKKIRQMPEMTIFSYSIEEIDRLYGQGKWTFKSWNVSEEIRFIPGGFYRVKTMRPVIRVFENDNSNEFCEASVPVKKLML